MELTLGILAIAVLAAVVLVNVLACRYYLSSYAKATRRGFATVARDPHAREVCRLSRKLAARDDGGASRLLFDVALPRDDAPSARADAVLVGERGIGVFCVQEGRGEIFGDADDGHWIVVGSARRDGSERLVPNLGVRAAEAAEALKDYLMLDAATASRVVAFAVIADAIGVDHAAAREGVALVHAKEAAGRLAATLSAGERGEVEDPSGSGGEGSAFAGEGSEPEGEGLSEEPGLADGSAAVPRAAFDEVAHKRVCRMLKACANAPAEAEDALSPSSDPPGRSEPAGWMRGIVQRERGETAAADLVRKADRLASSKEDFDALTWDRILDISAQLEGERDPERIGELAAELRLVARTNVSLNYRFGIAQAAGGAQLSPAGLVMESSVGNLAATEPDAQMRKALEDTDFFDGGDVRRREIGNDGNERDESGGSTT